MHDNNEISDEEFAFIGAGIGGAFQNTKELKPMKFKEAVKLDQVGWLEAVENEHKNMEKCKVWVPKSM